MDKILDMMAGWSSFGQGFFFFLALVILSITVIEVAQYGTVLFRGWPPAAPVKCPFCQEEE